MQGMIMSWTSTWRSVSLADARNILRRGSVIAHEYSGVCRSPGRSGRVLIDRWALEPIVMDRCNSRAPSSKR
jgi:hypothetical protein